MVLDCLAAFAMMLRDGYEGASSVIASANEAIYPSIPNAMMLYLVTPTTYPKASSAYLYSLSAAQNLFVNDALG